MESGSRLGSIKQTFRGYQMGNMRFAKRLSIYIAIPTIFGILLIWVMASLFASNIVNQNIKSQMSDVVKSRSVVINNFIQSAEESLIAFSLGNQVRELLLSPDDAELQKKAQQYTTDYSDTKKIFEGIYIADPDTHVLTHTSKNAVGIYTRDEDTIDWFRSTVFVKNRLSNFGVMISPGTGNMVISMYYPVFEEETCIGYVGCAVYADRLMQSLSKLTIDRLPNSRYILLDAKSGLYIYNTRSELINTITDDAGCLELIEHVKSGGEAVGEHSYYDRDGIHYLLSYSYIADKGWLFIVKDSYEEVYSDVNIVRSVLGAVCLGIAVIILLVTYFPTRKMGKELKQLEKSVVKLGKLDISAADDLRKYTGRQDEIGRIASAVNELCGMLNSSISDTGRILGEIAVGNLSVDIEKNKEFYVGGLAGLYDNIHTISKGLILLVNDITQAAKSVDASSRQVAEGAETLSGGSSEQSRAIDVLAENLREINKIVGENAESCVNAHDLMGKTFEHVGDANEKMTNLANAMSHIRDTSQKINEIIKTIEDISQQTNILALNASIEAARSGEAGKGFAVVAEEVRILAMKSTAAAKDSNQLIQQSVKAVNDGVEITESTSSAMNELGDYVSRVKEIIDVIASSSGEQAKMIGRISKEITEIEGIANESSQTARESAFTAKELSAQAELLDYLMEQFRT